MRLLAIETSTRIGSIALFEDGAITAHQVLDDDARRHGSLLAPAVAALPGFDPKRIDCYAIAIGPGSFTGLRIGLAFLKGLALVDPKPVVPVSTLEVIAEALLERHREASLALPVLDARRSEVYAALYGREGLDLRLPEGAYGLKDIADRIPSDASVVAAGDGVDLVERLGQNVVRAEPQLGIPDARVLARIAARKGVGQGVDVMSLEPAYHQRSPGE